MSNAYIVLQNGQVFRGKSFGAGGCITGELVFTTGMTGYLETLTDPSYYGQIVMQTFPLIGNYGVISDDFESSRSHVRGYIVHEWCKTPSNFRNQGDIDDFLKKQNVIGVYGVDTRALTKIIRESGVMNARLMDEAEYAAFSAVAGASGADANATPGAAEYREKTLHEITNYVISDAVAAVSAPTKAGIEKTEITAKTTKPRVVLFDYGAKANIARELEKRGCEVVCVNAFTSASEVFALNPAGIMLSNGPGNPAENTAIIDELQKICKECAARNIPIFGICLGHQLLALANGAVTEKLKYGHRGANQSVKEIKTGKTYISSQNHGYAVDAKTLPKNAELSWKNANDGTCEGLTYRDFPGFSVQFHPEASGGPHDTMFLFDTFTASLSCAPASW
ncbi:MAG: carbamoyl phosphate synthase small subunit [Treponemataceae bacterium]|nr:MAG: carbamoyl phosphate synthase small subunit [Treponemataceae bacterium]